MTFPLFEEFINSHTIKDLIAERNNSILVDADVCLFFYIKNIV